MAGLHKRRQPKPNSFRYRDLRFEDEFRLLRLHAGSGDSVRCSLDHYILRSDRCPLYMAVSYTWGKDAARHPIHMADDTVFHVRSNLKNALRSMRDPESDCWVWIDAICINQDSNVERNHQVKLMSNIYDNANDVRAWLQSDGEKADDVSVAFNFVTAAVAHDDSDHSVYHYVRSHPDGSERNWRSVQKLCRLRYWTRKWIIQELISARTVVLQAGKAECPMIGLERFCLQLQRHRHDEAYQNFNVNALLSSSAGRLALQRVERTEGHGPRLLHELVERYSENDCQEACDHVYALYSLVGNHRTHLAIDYRTTPVRRLVDVLRFAKVREALPPSKTLEFTNLLIRLLRITPDDQLRERHQLDSLSLVLSVSLLGTAARPEETNRSRALRKMVKPLDPIRTFTLDITIHPWACTAGDPPSPHEQVGRPNMAYFNILESGFHGLAACRLEAGDRIVHLPKTQLVFVVRFIGNDAAIIRGRAHLFSPDSNNFWLQGLVNYDGVCQCKRHISVSLATLLELSSISQAGERVTQPASDWNLGEKGWMEDEVQAVWSGHHQPKLMIVGSSLIFVLVLAVIVLQAVS